MKYITLIISTVKRPDLFNFRLLQPAVCTSMHLDYFSTHYKHTIYIVPGINTQCHWTKCTVLLPQNTLYIYLTLDKCHRTKYI